MTGAKLTALTKSPLGQATVYINTYSPDLLYPVPRSFARDKIGLVNDLPFKGVDIWNGFEISWLNAKGKPEIACGVFTFPCTTPCIVESKSFKLYLNSFTQTRFESLASVKQTMERDLAAAAGGAVTVELFYLAKPAITADFSGTCLDGLDIAIDTYDVDKSFLQTSSEDVTESLYSNLLKSNCLVTGLADWGSLLIRYKGKKSEDVTETLYSNLLKSNCLATGQADWGSLLIRYKGKKIDHAGLLKYIISFRNHSGFAEHCVEQIYTDIMQRCNPKQLTVYARYTRRGGLDINPFRSNFENSAPNIRQYRQ